MEMKTQEERTADAQKRKQEKTERLQRFPACRLSACREKKGVIVQLRGGETRWLEVHARGSWMKGPMESWTEECIPLDDPRALAAFIAALTARYNAMIEDMNTSASVRMISADSIP